jgi:membrane fusion protein (multidrug efflux system)
VEIIEVEPVDTDIYVEFLGQTFIMNPAHPPDPIWVRFRIGPAQFLSLLQKPRGSAEEVPRLELILSDNSIYPHTGEIASSYQPIDPRDGTLELEAEFPNPQHRLLPGRFGRVRYVTGRRTDVILVPHHAVQQNQKIQTVFVVGKGNKIRSRVVKTGPRVGEAWLIEQGLQPGDRVVVEGFHTVRPGMVVAAMSRVSSKSSSYSISRSVSSVTRPSSRKRSTAWRSTSSSVRERSKYCK